MNGFPLAESEVRDNRIYFRGRLFIPDNDELRLRLIQQAPDTPIAGHPGRLLVAQVGNVTAEAGDLEDTRAKPTAGSGSLVSRHDEVVRDWLR